MGRKQLGGVPLKLDPELLAGRGLEEAPPQVCQGSRQSAPHPGGAGGESAHQSPVQR